MRPRVVMIIERYVPLVGGSETQCRLLSRELHARGVPVQILTRRVLANSASSELVDGIPVTRLAPNGTGRVWKELIFALGACWWMIRNHKDFSLIHAHSATSLTGLCIVPVAHLLNKKIVIKVATAGDLHKEYIEIGKEKIRPSLGHRIFNHFINSTLRRADAVLCISHEIATEAKAIGLDEKKLVLIPNGVDTDLYSPISSDQRSHLRQSLHLPPDAPIILYTGRLIQRKGIDILISAWPKVQAKHPTARLVLLGGSSMSLDAVTASIEEEIRQLGPDSGILAIGEQSDALPYVQSASIFIFPSRREGLSNALLEAMSVGLPCVASAIGGNVDVIEDGVSGLLYPPESSPGLSEQLIRLLDDQALCQRLGTVARQKMLEHFEQKKVVTQTISLYTRLQSS